MSHKTSKISLSAVRHYPGFIFLAAWASLLAYLMRQVPPAVIKNYIFNVCADVDQRCEVWALDSECSLNPDYMTLFCRKSCNLCSSQKAVNYTHSMLVNNEANGLSASTSAQRAVKEPSLKLAGEEELAERTEKIETPMETVEPQDVDAEPTLSGLCLNLDDDCELFASQGECSKNPSWMEKNCARSCGYCPPCTDGHESCEFWAHQGECNANPDYMLANCPRSCQLCPNFENADAECKDRKPASFCTSRKASGDCDSNPGWMIVFCGKTCGKCDLISASSRCKANVFNDPNYRFEDARLRIQNREGLCGAT